MSWMFTQYHLTGSSVAFALWWNWNVKFNLDKQIKTGHDSPSALMFGSLLGTLQPCLTIQFNNRHTPPCRLSLKGIGPYCRSYYARNKIRARMFIGLGPWSVGADWTLLLHFQRLCQTLLRLPSCCAMRGMCGIIKTRGKKGASARFTSLSPHS